MNSVADLLRSIVGSGELIKIVYNGGSRPGEARQVVPVSLTNEELIAVEPGIRNSKQYKLNRIASAELANGQRALNADAQAVPVMPPTSTLPVLKTLAAYVELFRVELAAAGWHIYESNESFGLATKMKNGNPRKAPSISVQFIDRSEESVFDFESGEFKTMKRELTGRERPWRVDSWRLAQGKSFSELRLAVDLFLQEARASDPATARVVR